jgi:hypothetical protein
MNKMSINLKNILLPLSLTLILCVTLQTGMHPSWSAVTHKVPKPKPTPGGANQVGGLTGKVGDVLFDGKWRFQVISVATVPTYTLTVPNSEQDYSKWSPVAEYDDATFTFTPKTGYDLIAVKCHIKNGQNDAEQLDCYGNNPKTAIADANANSFPPIVYDMHTQGPLTTKPLLPGSGEDITVLFAVDSGTKPQSIVFTLKNWSANVGHNVRVTVPQPAPTSAP